MALPPQEPTLLQRAVRAFEANDPGQALALAARLIEIEPRNSDAWALQGLALRTAGQPLAALDHLDRAIALDGSNAVAFNNRGITLLDLRRPGEALDCFEKALELGLAHPATLNNRGIAAKECQASEIAAEAFASLLQVDPEFPGAKANLLDARLACCDWKDLDSQRTELLSSLAQGIDTRDAFTFLKIVDDPAVHRQAMRAFCANHYPPAPDPVWRGERYTHERIRVAYLSADFYGHATSFLMAGLLELHDRQHFEIHAISFGPPVRDVMRDRIEAAVDDFVDVTSVSDADIARMIREREIDIAVDVKGYTAGCRPGILARRPAPVQVNFLAFPGTMGAPYIDYIVADGFVIPATDRAHYAEHVIQLPGCYQVNDYRRAPAGAAPARATVGLPDNAFVFCCFSSNYKITPEVFSVWMRLLQRVPRSVLWLLEDNASARRNLQAEATARGVDPARLVFAPRVGQLDHLARHQCADLFLDTLPINAHTSASDALWAGLPLLTCSGRSFAARVAGSILHAAGIAELATPDLDSYEAKAMQLALSPGRLRELRGQLRQRIAASPLFDTGRYAGHLETAYRHLHARQQRGDPPAGFEVPASREPRLVTPVRTRAVPVAQQFHAILNRYQSGDVAGAGRDCEALLARQPSFLGALNLFAAIQAQAGRHGESLAMTDRALAVDPGNPETLYIRGDVQRACGNLDQSIDAYERALKARPQFVEAWINLGIAQFDRKDFAAAAKCQRRALELRPDHDLALFNLGNALMAAGLFDEATAALEKAATLKPEDHRVQFNLGNACLALQRFDRATECYERALATKPDFSAARSNLAVARQRAGKPPAAG